MPCNCSGRNEVETPLKPPRPAISKVHFPREYFRNYEKLTFIRKSTELLVVKCRMRTLRMACTSKLNGNKKIHTYRTVKLTEVVYILFLMSVHNELTIVYVFPFEFQCNDRHTSRNEFQGFSENNNGAFGPDESDGQSKEDQGDMSFCMSNYARETMKMMQMMRSHHMLTDVVLEVQTELFHAHKVVLSAASPYFKAMFTGGLKEAEMNRVKLQGVSNLFQFHILISEN